MANPPTNKPVKGNLRAWQTPPNAASLNAHRAVKRSIAKLLLADNDLFGSSVVMTQFC